jgi:hypothetical protein
MKSLIVSFILSTFAMAASATELNVVSIWENGQAFIGQMQKADRIDTAFINYSICFDSNGRIQMIYSLDDRAAAAYATTSDKNVVKINLRRLSLKTVGEPKRHKIPMRTVADIEGIVEQTTDITGLSSTPIRLQCVKSAIHLE